MTIDKPTPGDEPSKEGKGAIHVAVWTTVVLAAITTTVLLANDAQNLRRVYSTWCPKPEQETQASAEAPISEATGPATKANAVLRATALGHIAPLQRTVSAETRCSLLRLPKQPPPLYSVNGASSQCTTLHTANEKYPDTSVFLQIHTDIAGQVTFFRVKFNLGSSDGEDLVRMGFGSLRQYGNFSPEVDQSLARLEKKVREWKPFNYIAGPFRVGLSQEYTDGSRFNLTGTLHLKRAAPSRGVLVPNGNADFGAR